MIVFAPGGRLWDVDRHTPWLARVVIDVTIGAACLTGLVVFAFWFTGRPLRYLLAMLGGLASVEFVREVITHFLFVNRPFVAHHFVPLYPHGANSSFPSNLTGFFAAIALPAIFGWRRVGWLMAAVTIEVAVGCVYVGVHYVTDVLAGAAIGVGASAAVLGLLSWSPVAHQVDGFDAWLHRIRLRPS